ncbi:transcriptional regulator ATRX homolog isoform X5 [Spodoptera frugiperda]|uniref:DNA helicase n=2 Tax=Spodoptera frugiperda TaxID=7108 RepID=A0A9R0EJ53_SPOFR|nr:transcriptional regulator ATRX homolog isoform X5 [Spodoptera frugiperda]
MAAEVPVCDLLSEAVEYMSKLGVNLRDRSDSLIKKRINNKKLRNARAVLKAAEKVLLICELSKKSLANVETGVRKVLSIIDASQAQTNSSDGGKTSNSALDKRNDRFFYFEYESCTLRVSKKISIKHFTDVKVMAKKLPVSMQDKYPVFYDCKLKRLRNKSSENQDDKQADNCGKTKTKSKVFGEFPETQTSNVSDESDSNSCDKSTKEKDNLNEKKIVENDVIEALDSIALNDTSDTVQDDNVCDKQESNGNKDSNLGEDTAVSELIECFANEAKVDEDETCDGKLKKRKKEATLIRKKFSKIKIIDDDSSDSENNSKSTENVTHKISSSDEETNINSEKENDDKETKSKEKKSSNSDVDTNKYDSDNNSAKSDNSSKPLIRCVNISKLLKPDALSSETIQPSNQRQNTQSKSLISKHKEKEKKPHSNSKDDVQKQRTINSSDDEFWAQKRKEVKKFKPKQFSVNINRLPQFTTNFMLSHKLKRITQNNKTVYEVNGTDSDHLKKNIDKVKNALLNESGSDSDNTISHKAKKVKKSLLKNSDSERSSNNDDNSSLENGDDALSSKTNKVKESLLHDSDSELKEKSSNINSCSNNVDDALISEANKVKESLLNDSDTELKDKSSNNDFDTCSDNIDDALLAETNKAIESFINESNNQSKEQATNKSSNSSSNNQEDTTDNAVVKDALLHESDSGSDKVVTKDCDKELEKDVAKEIKDALLNDSESDKNECAQDETSNNATKDKVARSQNESDVSEHSDETEAQNPDKIKSSLLNDSSDSGKKSPISSKKKKKLKKLRRTNSKRQGKRNRLCYTSSSESEDELNIKSKEITHKHHKRKSRQSNSSSSSEENRKKKQKTDGTGDEHSDTGVSKMVRSKAKPCGSSGQNSDIQDASDKDIDGLTNLNTLNKKHRRRDSSSTNNTVTRSGGKKTLTIKTEDMKVTYDDLLSAAASSSEPSDDENMPEEELPTIPSGLNGDSIEHLAKDDLLGESDSSGSQNEKRSEAEETRNEEESEDEQNVKLKRQRKANAISSDSEGGTSHRKQRDEDVRVSDFEDSEDESSESREKRSKRKKKGSESDASGGSSNEGGQKKRRRIKQVKDSDGSGSDTENEGRNKHGRKNIRKVMGKNQLEEATKKAAREEKERIARITERQKLYNNMEFDESGKPDEVVLEKVVLDFDPETKEPLIEVDRGLVKKLKPHQANGIKFMWDACFESVKRIKKDKGSGCILAHCMGLGKTLQVISLTHTLLTHGTLTGVNRVLVVCPLSTVLNWVNEFKMWLKHAHSEFEVDVYELSRYKQNSERAFQLQQWFEGGGVCVLGYEMFRNLSADNNKKFKKKMLRSFQESLVDPGPDLVVCDEGHLLKNEKTSLSQSMNRVKTRRRIVLTGTPLQNNLKEYYCMVQFVKPNLLGKYNEYLNRFVNPITNGQYTDSTEHDIKVMKRRSHVLHKMLDGAVQRRDYGVLAPFLPPKHEYVLFITLSDVQVKLYQFYLDNYSRRPLPGKSSGFLFPDFQSLQRIWTHPLVLKYNSERYEIMQQKKREREEEDSEGSLVDFIDDDSTPEETSTEESTDELSDMSDDSRKKSKKKNKGKKSKGKDSKVGTRRGTRANPVEADEDDPDVAEVVEVRNENPTEWWIKLVEEEELDDMRNSHKLVLLFDILRQCEAIGDKLLVFSQSLYSLDLIEHFLGKVDEATQEGRIDEKLGGHVGSWSPGVDYFRLDGSTSCENRSIWCKNFNREDNPRARLFLISTRAGGLGINLVAANRVVIFDVSWNPSHDVQSIFRVYRFGQKKPCYIYRFLAMGTMEEKIYERQVTKQAISKRVIDEQQIDRHYAENDLAELYKFEARPDEPRPIPALPKDRLFAEMLREHEAQIYKYHEHDSLLENKEEETLSEEERKAAWEDFENEKNRPPPAPFPSAWPMHNGMMPGLLAAQQQQLAYAALAAMLRKDMPNINDNQIRDMLPLIYNSNPGLMQKMSELYKYAPPGMMNPGMMNAVMNSGGGASASSGSAASSLQYEPPWQRQQQQQHHMRLQQLMQQNQMGAKIYAGGLGSRDPVAMALQQQRSREILMAGSRPRGRPPLAARAPPPTTAQDVVNLDSD